MVVDAAQPQPSHWKEIVPEAPDAVIETMGLAGGHIYLSELQNVIAHLRVYSLDGTAGGEVPLPGIGSVGRMSGEWAGREGYFQFSSFNVPPTIYRYDFTTGNAAPWWKSSAPMTSDMFEVRQFAIHSTGDAKVPFFVVAPT